MLRWRSGIHTALTAEGGVLLDERSGGWTFLAGSASIAAHLLTTVDAEQAVTSYASRFRIPNEQASSDLKSVTDALTVAGKLIDDQPRRSAWRRCR